MLHPPGTVPPGSGSAPLLADRYRIERELGRGGMAVVYLAWDTRHDRRVAIKFIGDAFGTAVGTQRFLQEIKLTAALQHPHVLAVYDSGVTSDNVLYYVMPYVEGGSLRARLQRGPLPVAECVRIARNVADALGFAHQRGIIHRDVKPENILFAEGIALVADFGIARLVTNTNAEQLTAVGVIVGTPAYMSPEQGFGGSVDVRSDVYSLACVVYEMLTGKVPFASPAAGQWTQFGLTRMPPPLRAERADVPEAVEAVLVRALAPSPDDRYASAREFADALEGGAAGVSQAAATSPVARTLVRRSRRAWRAGMIAGAAVVLVALTSLAFFRTPLRDQLVAAGMLGVDPSLALVAPVQAADSADLAAARAAERALRAELSGWSGISVESPEATRDALGAASVGIRLDDAIRAARRARAGLLLWARVRTDGRGTTIEAQLYDPRTEVRRSAASGAAPSSDSAWTAWSTDVVPVLLAAGDAPAAARRAAGGTRSYPAWSAFVEGHRALDRWQLPRADSAFSSAIMADPRFASARAWLAQVQVWSRRVPVRQWQRHAEESLMLAGALDPAERLMARAVAALGAKDAPQACGAYGRLLTADSLNPRWWLGLGDCHGMDDAVIRSGRSATGWAFRGNFTAAMAAYERAVRLSPRAHVALPFAWVERLIPTQVDRFRSGIALHDSTMLFGARPTPSGDSVVYVPAPIVGNRLPDDPAGFEEALHRNRQRMLAYVTAWTQRAPADRDAYEALASVQEARGELLGVAAGGRLSALTALDSAHRLTTDAVSRVRIAAARIRVLVKSGEFEAAGELADSLLARAGSSAGEAHWLAGIAALTGRLREAARLARLGDAPPVGGWDTLPAPVGQAATLLLVQAAAGVCEGLRGAVEHMDGLVESYAVPAQREATRAELTFRARRLAVPCLGAAQVASLAGRSPWDRMQQRLATGDAAGVRAVFDTLQLSRRNRRPGGTAVDFTFTGAWLLAAAGDTAGAIRHLDQTLNALPTLNRNAVWELAQSAALVRTMAWRADLAQSSGDMQNASRWASAAATLWRHADPELQPLAGRMRALANP